MAERLHIAATVSIFLSQKEVMSGVEVEAISRTLYAPHMDGDKKRAYFWRHRQVEGAEVLERTPGKGCRQRSYGRQFDE